MTTTLRNYLLAATTLLVIAAVGCSDCGQSAASPGELQQGEASRVESPRYDSELQARHAEVIRALGFELLHRRRAEGQTNPLVAPYGATVLAAQLSAGANSGIAPLFGDGVDDETLHGLFNAIDHQLERYVASGDAQYTDIPAIWVDETVPVTESYLDVLARHYGSGVHRLPFQETAGESVHRINPWLARQTTGAVSSRVSELFDIEEFTVDDPVAATSTVQFYGRWQYGFERQPDPVEFERADGGTDQVEMMHGKQMYRFARPVGTVAAAIGYQGANVTFLAMMPSNEEADFDEWIADVDRREFDRIVEELGSLQEGTVFVPRFELVDQFDLGAHLEAMELEVRVDGHAQVDSLLQTAGVKIDEHGGRRATGEERQHRGGLGDTVGTAEVRFNRPFLFAVYDQGTEVPLLLGVFEGDRGG